MSSRHPRKNAPLPYAGAYSLHLYCDRVNVQAHPFDTGFAEYVGETLGECLKQARQRGWVIHKDRTATCPRCT